MMMTETPHGLYPYAGIPWFSTPFGRDGLITAFELLWRARHRARRAVVSGRDAGHRHVRCAGRAARQDPARDARRRDGGARRSAVRPLLRHASTRRRCSSCLPLRYCRADRGPALSSIGCGRTSLAALDWMDALRRHRRRRLHRIRAAQRHRARAAGLEGFAGFGVPRGWHAGRAADRALRGAGLRVRRVAGRGAAGRRCAATHVAARRWTRAGRAVCASGSRTRSGATTSARMRSRSTRDKRPCRVRTSNPGHCLFTGIASPAHARRGRRHDDVASDRSADGASARSPPAQARYNPMSYHNGSVWPHDNAIVAAGLARYGFTAAPRGSSTRCSTSARSWICTGCRSWSADSIAAAGIRRSIRWPVRPQAWAAGAVYLLLEACLGLRVDATERRVSFSRAVLPESIDWLRIMKARVGSARVDLLLTRHPYNVGVTVIRRDGDIDIVALK